MKPVVCKQCTRPLTPQQIQSGTICCSTQCMVRYHHPHQHHITPGTKPMSSRDIARQLQDRGIMVSHDSIHKHPNRVVWQDGEPVSYQYGRTGRPRRQT
jgi:hypothetical protein